MKKISTKSLGLTTEIIGYLLTYGSMIIWYVFYYYRYVRRDGILALIGVIILFVIIHFYGKAIYSLYSKFNKYENNEIELKSLIRAWYSSLFNSVLLFIISLFLSLSLILSNDFNFRILAVFIPILLIPQFILLKRTNLNFIKKNKFKRVKGYLKLKIQWLKSKTKNLKQEEIIILCIIIGVISGLIVGYLLGDKIYFKGQERISNSRKGHYGVTSEFNFNYLLGISTLIISSGTSYLLINKNKEQ